MDEKDPIVTKLREMLFLKHIIRCAHAGEAAARGCGLRIAQRSNPASNYVQDGHPRIQ